jgi:phosphodiesterase/alkaline phosphatase D-like protein
VGGHHYALVRMSGLEPGKTYDYEVLLDGALVWPEPGSPFPPSRIRTLGEGEPVKLVFGSCRISAPHEPPHTLGPEDDERGLGVDALYSTAMRLRDEPAGGLPHALVLLGDQIYAHKPPFDTLDFIRSRRDTSAAPGEVVANFVEYARLYRDAWGDPAIRWLLSTVSSAMIFDDHEVGDDWNVSAAWVEEVRHQPHWNAQIAGGHVSYLVYQHPGNLSPQELQDNDLYAEIRATEGPPTTPGPSCATPTARTGTRRWRVGASAATSETSGCSRSTPGAEGCWMRADAPWSTPASGPG